MRFRNVFFLGCAVLAALSIPALGRPSPRGVEQDARAKIQKPAKLMAAKPSAKKPSAKKLNVKPQKQLHAQRPVAHERQAAAAPAPQMSKPLFGWPSLVSEARKYIGTNPTAMQRRWCARFMNFVLARVGYAGTGSDAARSFASYGERLAEPKVGAIAVLTRGKNRAFGHVGVITGLDSRGNPIIISGNHGRTVAESVYPRARVIAYVMPKDGGGTRPMQRILQPLHQRMAQPQQQQQQTPLPPQRPLPPHRVIQQGPVQLQLRTMPSQPSQRADKPAFAVAVEETMTRMFGDAALTR